jgi:hypothetical protein
MKKFYKNYESVTKTAKVCSLPNVERVYKGYKFTKTLLLFRQLCLVKKMESAKNRQVFSIFFAESVRIID